MSSYQVLARKYRPDNFDTLIGQDALVQTLTNAITLNRLAHSFVLTGVRGVGKTTTARIIAKGLNCIGPDGTSKASMHPCNQCEPCRTIQSGHHVDILEMDAASNTGIDDIREIIDSSVYRPVSARYKIYIIDEVHMLSKNAFNALLKTLEEPSESVKFIFATTEIRKVPLTILSRCQRFDLRRIPIDLLVTHLTNIALTEKIKTQPEAIRLLAYAAEGSVRDSLSLLDQASALGANNVTLSIVENMLGHASTNALLDLLQSCLMGDIRMALSALKKAVDAGAEPEQIISDLMDITHQASLIASKSNLEDISDSVQEKLSNIAKFGIPRLARCWQIFLKGLQEIRLAPRPEASAQMLLIRLVYTSPMPTPSEIIEKLPKLPTDKIQTNSLSSNKDQILSERTTSESENSANLEHQPLSSFKNLIDIVNVCEQQGSLILASDIRNYVRLINLKAPLIEISLTKGAPDDLPSRITHILNANSEQQWEVYVGVDSSLPTLQEKDKNARQEILSLASEHPVAREVLKTFPGAKITDVVTSVQSQNHKSSSSSVKSDLKTSLEQLDARAPINEQEKI